MEEITECKTRTEEDFKDLEIVKKINKIFKKGYLPSRKNQSYSFVTKRGLQLADITNCIEHSFFNLQNFHFDSYNITKEESNSFFLFANMGFTDPQNQMLSEIIAFVKATGLKVKPCHSDKKLKENQWKVAVYYSEGLDEMYISDDMHFILEEQDGTWSSKMGQTEDLKTYACLPKNINTFFRKYELIGTYQVTNPYLEK